MSIIASINTMDKINFDDIRCIKCYSEKTLINCIVKDNPLEISSVIYCSRCSSLFPVIGNIPFFLLQELIEPHIYEVAKELFDKETKKL